MSKYLDNKHWLVTLEIGNAENNYIVISDKNPIEDEDFCENILQELEADFVSDYSYLYHDTPQEEDYATEEEYNEAVDAWYNDFVSEISVHSKLITKDNIENYGESWLDSQPVIWNLELIWYILYQRKIKYLQK